jgi:arylsulfatase A-like enzyme
MHPAPRLVVTSLAVVIAAACSRDTPAPATPRSDSASQPSAAPAPSRASATAQPDPTDATAKTAPTDASAAAPEPATAASAARREPMNVILLTIDALRSDMPWNGYPRNIAPNLAALYARSVRYPHAYAVSSFTSKSVPAILSGRYPSELHRSTPFFSQYHARNRFAAEVMHDAGIRTLAAHAHMYLDKPSGLTQGFDVWKLVPGIAFDYNKDPYVTSHKLTPLAIDILSKPENTSGRFFAFFHFMDPHDDYQAHSESPKFGRRARDLYDEEVFYTDLWVKKLLDFIAAQPWASKTAIILSSDHGEAFGEHKLYRHAFEIYDVLVHVPMFFLVPGAKPREVPAWRGQIDLAPTIYELLGMPADESLPGKSLVPEVFGEDLPARPIVCDLPADSHNERRRALIEGGWKIIAFGKDFRYELYDLEHDPGELVDLHKKDKARFEAMRARYKQVSATIQDVKAFGGPPVKE